MNIEEITKKELENWIVTALEGGSNYWYYLSKNTVDTIKELTPELDGEPLSIRFTRALFEIQERNAGAGLAINEKDGQVVGQILGRVTIESSIKAIKDLAHSYPKLYAHMVNGGYDANDADVWFQMAVMGKVNYG